MLYMGFTAWFEGAEVGVRALDSAPALSLERWMEIIMNEYEICLSLGEISRMPSPDEITIQFDLL